MSHPTYWLLLAFLVLPRIIFISTTYAYKGIVEERTLGLAHFGVRTGNIARLYGVFYALAGVLMFAFLLIVVIRLISAEISEIVDM